MALTSQKYFYFETNLRASEMNIGKLLNGTMFYTTHNCVI